MQRTYAILCVDDEEGIVDSLERALRLDPCVGWSHASGEKLRRWVFAGWPAIQKQGPHLWADVPSAAEPRLTVPVEPPRCY